MRVWAGERCAYVDCGLGDPGLLSMSLGWTRSRIACLEGLHCRSGRLIYAFSSEYLQASEPQNPQVKLQRLMLDVPDVITELLAPAEPIPAADLGEPSDTRLHIVALGLR